LDHNFQNNENFKKASSMVPSGQLPFEVMCKFFDYEYNTIKVSYRKIKNTPLEARHKMVLFGAKWFLRL